MKELSAKTINGLGKVMFSPDKKLVKADLEVSERGDDGKYKTVRKSYKFRIENCPEGLETRVRYKVRLLDKPGQARQMLSFYPADGRFIFKHSRFSSKEGEVPAPKVNQSSFPNQQGEYDTYETFVAFIKIAEGEFMDLEVPVFLHYNFAGGDSGETGYSKLLQYSKNTRYLDEYLTAIGVANILISYSDNILPTIDKMAQQADTRFEASISDGNVSSFSWPIEVTEEATEEDDWNDDSSQEDDVPDWTDGTSETEEPATDDDLPWDE